MCAVSNWRDLRERAADGREALLGLLESAGHYKAMPHQRRAHLAAPHPGDTIHKLFLGGIGAGKTMWGAAEDVMMAIANPGCLGAVLAPTYDQVKHVVKPEIQRLTDAMATAGYPLVRKWYTADGLAELHCGGKILLRSADRIDSIRGFNFAYGHLDEPAAMRRPEYVFDVLAGRLRDPAANIRQIHLTTTPRGLYGNIAKFHAQRQIGHNLGGEAGARHLASWWIGRAPSNANTHLPAGYLDALRSGYSRRQWEQEVEAKVLRPETAVFPEFSRETHAVPYAYDPALPYDVAVDWGHQFPHVLWIQRRGDGAMVVFAEFCDDNVPRDHLRAAIKRGCNALGAAPVNGAGDRAVKHENSWFRDAFPTTRFHVMRTRVEQDVRTGLEGIRTLLDPMDGPPALLVSERLTRDPPRRGIVKCLENYRYKQRMDGSLSPDPLKDGTHDHGIDSLRYFVIACGLEDRTPYAIGRSHGGRAEMARPPWMR